MTKFDSSSYNLVLPKRSSRSKYPMKIVHPILCTRLSPTSGGHRGERTSSLFVVRAVAWPRIRQEQRLLSQTLHIRKQQHIASYRWPTVLRWLFVIWRMRRSLENLWIYAICINQDEMMERSAEVCKMDSIYRRASQVVVGFGATCAAWILQ